jgi:hypothetical protein
MRRLLSWPCAVLVLAALLPGLLSFAAFPVAAQARVINETAGVQAKPDTPKQMMGSGTHMPSSVRTFAVQSNGGSAASERGKPVRGALPLDVRPAVRQQAVTSDLPAGVQRAELADQQTLSDTFPMIDDTYPETGSLVSATPLLVLEYTRLGAGSVNDKGLSVSFEICDIPEDPDPFPPAPVPVCVESGALGWVYSWRVPAGKLEWGKEYKWSATVRDLDSGASV